MSYYEPLEEDEYLYEEEKNEPDDENAFKESDKDADKKPEEDVLHNFIRETHINLVMRMMHFYDLLAIGNESLTVFQKVTNVLKFIGWNYEGINEHFIKFFKDIQVDLTEVDLERQEIRCIFKSWIEKVSSNPVLLLKCFAIFDHDSDGHLSKEEIIEILHKTTDKQRIDLFDNITSKLDGIYYKKELGLDFFLDTQSKGEVKTKMDVKKPKKQVTKASLFHKVSEKFSLLFILVWLFNLLLTLPLVIIFTNYLDDFFSLILTQTMARIN
jgi:hypothetical protein